MSKPEYCRLIKDGALNPIVTQTTHRSRIQPAPEPAQNEPDDTFNWHYWMWLATLGTIVAVGILF